MTGAWFYKVLVHRVGVLIHGHVHPMVGPTLAQTTKVFIRDIIQADNVPAKFGGKGFGILSDRKGHGLGHPHPTAFFTVNDKPSLLGLYPEIAGIVPVIALAHIMDVGCGDVPWFFGQSRKYNGVVDRGKPDGALTTGQVNLPFRALVFG